MRHRGPDDEGYLLVERRSGECISCGGSNTDGRLSIPRIESFMGKDCSLALGFRRLSILDLTTAGHQPMSSGDGRFWIVFNGEIYNYLELREELAGDGCSFRSGTDTEVVLAAYAKWGVRCLEHFNGMWAFAIWDNREKKLFLARDRFGVKPLFFAGSRRGFIFASEIKAIVGRHGIPFEADSEAVYDYLARGVLPSQSAEKTFFKGVNILPPGSFVMLDGDAPCRETYWNLRLDTAGREEKSCHEAVSEYGELLRDAVRIRLRSDVPVGTCLSGGLDSTSIACLLNSMVADDPSAYGGVAGRQMTFSAVYDTRDRVNEKPYIDKALQSIRAEGFFTMPGFEGLAADLEKLVWHQEEPFPTTSIFAQWCVMKLVHEQGIKVLLDGQGADEALGGYRPFDVFYAQLLREGRISLLIDELMSFRDAGGGAASRLKSLARALAWQAPGFILDALGGFREKAGGQEEYLAGSFVSRLHRNRDHRREEWRERSDLSLHLRRLLQESLLPHLLRFEDRNSMAFSVEARLPFMDYRLVEFAFNQGRRWRMNQGWTKWILRKAMENVVPASILWRVDKVGFETPEKEWLRQLVTGRTDFFQRRELCGEYLDVAKIEDRAGSYGRGETACPDGLWRWINLDVWLKTWTS